MRWLQGSLLVVALLLATSPAFGEILFDDNFDTDTVGANPVAEVGTWTFWNGSNVLVADAADPGPVSSPNYLTVIRDAGVDGGAYANFTGQSDPNDVVRAEFDWYANGAYSAQIQFLSPAGGYFTYFSLANDGTVTSGANVVKQVDTEEWHNIAIEYSPTATTCDVFIDNVLEGDDVGVAGAGSNFGQILFYTTSTTGATTHYDNVQVSIVPEPSSVALLLSGLVGLLAYAWRKRK